VKLNLKDYYTCNDSEVKTGTETYLLTYLRS
jgi:hypothetical protein